MIHIPTKLGFERFKNDGKKATLWKFGNDLDSAKWFSYFGVLSKLNLSLYADASCRMLRCSFDILPSSRLTINETALGGKKGVISLEVIKEGDILSAVYFSTPDPEDQDSWYISFDEAIHRGFRPVSFPPVGSAFYPKVALLVEYPDSGVIVDDGNLISLKLLQHAPTIRYDIFHEVQTPFHTLLMIDCDSVPMVANTKELIQDGPREFFLHWAVVNMDKYDTKQQVAPYVSPVPAPLSGLHRYIFLLYRQPAYISETDVAAMTAEVQKNGRMGFSLSEFLNKYKLGSALGINGFYSVSDAKLNPRTVCPANGEGAKSTARSSPEVKSLAHLDDHCSVEVTSAPPMMMRHGGSEESSISSSPMTNSDRVGAATAGNSSIPESSTPVSRTRTGSTATVDDSGPIDGSSHIVPGLSIPPKIPESQVSLNSANLSGPMKRSDKNTFEVQLTDHMNNISFNSNFSDHSYSSSSASVSVVEGEGEGEGEAARGNHNHNKALGVLNATSQSEKVGGGESSRRFSGIASAAFLKYSQSQRDMKRTISTLSQQSQVAASPSKSILKRSRSSIVKSVSFTLDDGQKDPFDDLMLDYEQVDTPRRPTSIKVQYGAGYPTVPEELSESFNSSVSSSTRSSLRTTPRNGELQIPKIEEKKSVVVTSSSSYLLLQQNNLLTTAAVKLLSQSSRKGDVAASCLCTRPVPAARTGAGETANGSNSNLLLPSYCCTNCGGLLSSSYAQESDIGSNDVANQFLSTASINVSQNQNSSDESVAAVVDEEQPSESIRLSDFSAKSLSRNPSGSASVEELCDLFHVNTPQIFNGAACSKKFSRDFMSKDSFLWISPVSKTLHWAKCSSATGEAEDEKQRWQSKYVILEKESAHMKPDTAARKMSKLSPIAAHDQALSIANYKGTLIAGKLVDRSITINLSTGEWLKFQIPINKADPTSALTEAKDWFTVIKNLSSPSRNEAAVLESDVATEIVK